MFVLVSTAVLVVASGLASVEPERFSPGSRACVEISAPSMSVAPHHQEAFIDPAMVMSAAEPDPPAPLDAAPFIDRSAASFEAPGGAVSEAPVASFEAVETSAEGSRASVDTPIEWCSAAGEAFAECWPADAPASSGSIAGPFERQALCLANQTKAANGLFRPLSPAEAALLGPRQRPERPPIPPPRC